MRFAIKEDQALLLDILRTACGDITEGIILNAATADDVVFRIKIEAPELLIIDVKLTNIDGLDLISQIRREIGSRIKIFVITDQPSYYLIYRLEKDNIDGFMDIRTVGLDELHRAIGSFVRGMRVFSSIFSEFRQKRILDSQSFDKLLSKREMGVLRLISKFWSDAEIATCYGISERTVELHRLRVMDKLGCHQKNVFFRKVKELGFMYY